MKRSVTQRLAMASAAHPWRTLALWGVILLLAIASNGLLLGSALTPMGGITTEPESIKGENLLKERFGDRDAVIASVRQRHADHVAKLADYEASRARFYPDASAVPDEQLGAWLVLRGGIRAEQGGLEWCEEILQALDPQALVPQALGEPR